MSLGLATPTLAARRVEEFPQPAGLRMAVAFWMRVYLEVTTQSGLLHDSRHLGVVYETVHFDGEKGKRARQRKIDERKRHWRRVLRRLAKVNKPKDAHEVAVLNLLELELGHPPKPKDFRTAAHRIRFQLGQRDKFRKGIIRSGAYENVMRSIFRQAGLPEDLSYLPHVESSFNLLAYSKYGAAGVWQFMRSTAKRYLRVDYIVDERLDPLQSTRAAARLLRDNHKALETWPLAITAYNHGVAGMRRAKRKLATDDFVTIRERYRSRTFGFASRNFYAQFLAARKILRAHETYFGPLKREVPEAVDEITLPFFASVKDLKTHLGLSPEVIRLYNPSLRPPVFRSGKRVPKDFLLRLPAGTVLPSPDEWLVALPEKLRYAKQHRSSYHRVRRGDTLSRIAARNRTTVGKLVVLNNLPSRHRIYPGQILELPGRSGRTPKRRFRVVKTAQAKPIQNPIPRATIQSTTGPPPSLPEGAPWRQLDGNFAIVDASETLGHYADWLQLPTQRLRDLNGISGRRPLHMGRRLKLDFSRTTPETFLRRRLEYHKGIEEDFFGSFKVTGTIDHKLRYGESIWVLSHRMYHVPTWLIQRYNPDMDLSQPKMGTTLKVPVVERVGN